MAMLDDDFEHWLDLGRRNQEVLELVRRHCSHAVVEKPAFGGRGMLEASTGLPLDTRTVRCPHASSPAGAGMQLQEIALAFWRANCRGCIHRDLRDVPNLATLGEQRLAEEQERAERAEAEKAERDHARQQRANERAGRVAGESQAVRDFVALLDGIDAETADRRGQDLVDLARAAPERCTDVAGRILAEAALTILSDQLLEALDCLERAGRIPAERLLEASMWQLSERPSRVAASIAIRLRDGIRAGDLTRGIRHLVWLSGTPTEPFDSPPPYPEAIALAADVDLPAVLDELRDGLGDVEDQNRRGRWASAAAELATGRPETAEVLAEPVARSLLLPGSGSVYAGSPHSGIHSALVAVLTAKPIEVDAIFVRVAPHLTEEARKSVFHAYDTVLSVRWGSAGELSDEAVGVLLDAVFARLQGDWGWEVTDRAVDSLDSIARDNPRLLAERVDAVFGALLAMVADQTSGGAGFGTATLLQPPNPLSGLERHGRVMMRNANVRRLRDVVGRLAPLEPESTLAGVEAILDRDPLGNSEAGDELRSNAVTLLGDLGRIPELGPRVLPRLVTLSLGQDVVLRTRAITALGKLQAAPHRQLPADVIEFLPGWLADPYKGPHQEAVRLLRGGWPVPDSILVTVLRALVILAGAYASDDKSVLEDVLLVLWRLTDRLPPDETAMFQRFVLVTAEHLSRYDLERFVQWSAPRSCDPRNLGHLADRLLQVLSDEERIADPNRREDPLVRQLRDLPPSVLADRVELILTAATNHLPHVMGALEYVEVLQRFGDYDAASKLAAQVLAYLPQTAEAEVVRGGVAAVAAAAAVELAFSRGDLADVLGGLERWDAALRDRRRAQERRVDPWEIF
jgi:hypothetical protein